MLLVNSTKRWWNKWEIISTNAKVKHVSRLSNQNLSYFNYQNFSEVDLGPKNTQDEVHGGIALQPQSQ